MGTDESTIESERFARVRGQLSAPEAVGVGPAGVCKQLPSPAIEGVQSVERRELHDVAGDSQSRLDRRGGGAA